MRLGGFGVDTSLQDFFVETVGSGLVVEEGIGQRVALGIDIDIFHTVESQDGLCGLLVGLAFWKQLVAEFYLRTAIVVGGGESHLVEDVAYGGAVGAVCIITYKDVMFVQMWGHRVYSFEL